MRLTAASIIPLVAIAAEAALAQFAAQAPVAVSGVSPFADCTSDDLPVGGTRTPNSGVEPWIAVNPNDPDHLVASWMQDSWSTGGARGIVAAVSLDGGESWERGVIPGLSICSGGELERASDPWFAFSPNGDLHHIELEWGFFWQDRINVSTSMDGGVTWRNPIAIDRIDQQQAVPGTFNDKPSITVDPTDARFVYAVWVRFRNGGADGGVTRFSRSTDGGASWEPARVIDDPSGDDWTNGHQIVVLPDGTLVLVMIEAPNGSLGIRQLSLKRSPDRGATWLPAGDPMPIVQTAQPALVLSSVAGVPKFVDGAEQGFDVAVDRTNGALYLVWQDTRFIPSTTTVAFSMSTDAGFTWSEPVGIAKTPRSPDQFRTQSFLPSVHVNDQGVVGVTYYDFRNDDSESQILTDYWFIHCDPAPRDCTNPESWQQEVRLTPESFDFLAAPPVTVGIFQDIFLGHYFGLTSAGRDFLALFGQSSTEEPATVFFSRIAGRVEVEIDIKPTIKPGSRGVVPVAILGSESFDVAGVDATTLAFGRAGAPLAHRHGPHPVDTNRDGFADLLVHFRTAESGISASDEEACVTGELFDGTPFEGCDSTSTVPPR